MSLVTVQTWIKDQLNGMILPGSADIGALDAYITPPDPRDDPPPAAYIWPLNGEENRQSFPRNTGPGTPAGWKNYKPDMNVHLIWFNDTEDPYVDNAFPSVVDAVMHRLRTSPDPAKVTDPNTGEVSWLGGVGERMSWQNLGITATNDQRWNRYDALIKVPFTEYLNA